MCFFCATSGRVGDRASPMCALAGALAFWRRRGVGERVSKGASGACRLRGKPDFSGLCLECRRRASARPEVLQDDGDAMTAASSFAPSSRVSSGRVVTDADSSPEKVVGLEERRSKRSAVVRLASAPLLDVADEPLSP